MPGDLIDVWNRNRGTLPEAKGLGKTRLMHARARLAEIPDLPRWESAVKRTAASPFCRGETNGRGDGHPWVANIDWFLKPDSILKIEEGMYDERLSPEERQAEQRRLKKEKEDAEYLELVRKNAEEDAEIEREMQRRRTSANA